MWLLTDVNRIASFYANLDHNDEGDSGYSNVLMSLHYFIEIMKGGENSSAICELRKHGKDFFFFFDQMIRKRVEYIKKLPKTHPSFLIHAVVINIYKFFWISAWLIDMSPEILMRE